MKRFALIAALLLAALPSASAQRFVVISSGGGGCTGTIDLSSGCKLPMLGG